MSVFKSPFSFIGLTDDKYVIVKEEPKNSKDSFTMPLPKDNVNHPKHYTKGGIECIDTLKAATVGKTGIEAVCVANIIKYLWRYEEKTA